MCECCVADCDYIDEVLPGWHLERAKKDGHVFEANDFGLVRMNDPDFVFSMFPTPEPQKEMTDEEIEALPAEEKDKWNNWNKGVATFDGQLKETDADFRVIYKLVAAAKEKGYDEDVHGWFAGWLFDYLGECLKAKGIVK